MPEKLNLWLDEDVLQACVAVLNVLETEDVTSCFKTMLLSLQVSSTESYIAINIWKSQTYLSRKHDELIWKNTPEMPV